MKKLFNIGAAAVMALSLAACSSSTAAKDGTYTSTQKGFGGDVTVTLTVKDGAFGSVEIVGDSETPTVGGVAIPELQTAINEAKSADVDAYSGATVTSDAVLKAAADCFEQAGLTK